jgi:hypothetical protein
MDSKQPQPQPQPQQQLQQLQQGSRAMLRLTRVIGAMGQPQTAAAAAASMHATSSSSSSSSLAHITQAKPDAIFGVKAKYKADTDADKINLSVGAYRTDAGKPLVLRCVRKAEQILANDTSLVHEYLPITGDVAFRQIAQKLVFGVNDARIATVQSLSGTGSLRLVAEFIKLFMPKATVYVSNPTWYML